MTPRTDATLRLYADNSVLVLVSRLAMAATPVVASALVTLGSFYLEARFEGQRTALVDLDRGLKSAQAEIDGIRSGVADVRQAVAVNAQVVTSLSDQQRQTQARLEKMTDALGTLSSTVSGLAATVGRLNR